MNKLADGAVEVPSMEIEPMNEPEEERRWFGAALQAVKQAVTLATLLRTIGATAMVASISVFLLQGFDTQGDLTRVFMLLGQSALLAVTGLLVGFALREPKGARVFLSLALVSVPANFAVLAAMVYSIAPLDGGLALDRYPEFAQWQATSLKDLGIALLAGLALLVPTTVFAFKVLARRLAMPMSMTLLAGSLVLLIPVRDPALVAVTAALLVLGTITVLLRIYRRLDMNARLMTFEEKLANLLLLIAPGIMIGRSLLVHGLSDNASFVMAATVYCLLYHVTRALRHTVRRQQIAAVLTMAAAITTACLFLLVTVQTLPALPPFPGFVGVLSVLLYPLATRTESPAIRRLASGCWTFLASLTVLLGAFLAYSLFDILSVIALSMAIAAVGILSASTRRILIGFLGSIAVALLHFESVLTVFADTGWIGLAGLGVVAIVLGSVLERFGPALKLRFSKGSVKTDGPESDDRAADQTTTAAAHATMLPCEDKDSSEKLAA